MNNVLFWRKWCFFCKCLYFMIESKCCNKNIMVYELFLTHENWIKHIIIVCRARLVYCMIETKTKNMFEYNISHNDRIKSNNCVILCTIFCISCKHINNNNNFCVLCPQAYTKIINLKQVSNRNNYNCYSCNEIACM